MEARLKIVLHGLVSECQTAFVSGRLLLNSVLVADEVVDYATKKNKGCLLFEVDFEKTYDKVS